MHPIHTIGHSNHPIDRFIGLLQGAAIDLLIDVRSIPASRRYPHFNRAALTASLRASQLDYLWLGETLGGRPPGKRADYPTMAGEVAFQDELTRVLELGRRYRAVLMCAEREPLDCHRTVLVGRHLADRGGELRHILSDGRIETQEELETRLLQAEHLDDADLFAAPRPERINRAWNARARKMTAK